MSNSSSMVFSFVTAKCPNCGKGNVFKDNLYSFNFIEVKKECECCSYNFMPEPGFYYGAMYFTYAINVAIIIISLILFNLFTEKFPPFTYLVTTFCIVFFSINIIVRMSRLLMLYLFGKPRQ